MEHILKCWPEHYAAIERGAKTCELRLNDRSYQVGDTLLLREFEPLGAQYTSQSLRVRVTHILNGGVWLSPGYIAMSIQLLATAEWKAVAERQGAETEHIKQAANALIDEARNPVHDHWNDWIARLKAKADNLNTRVSSHAEPAQSEETQEAQALRRIYNGEANSYQLASNGLGLCPRCGRSLNNLSPGISVVAGGVSVCTSCLAPGETEVARAKGISSC